MEYVWIPMLMPFGVIVLVGFFSYLSHRNRYSSGGFFESRRARYIAILILLAIALPIFITGIMKKNPEWASFGMIVSYIFMGLAAGLLFNPIIRILTTPIRFVKKARKTFITNISTYGTSGVGAYYGTGMDDEINGVPVKWKMRFTFTDFWGRVRKDTSIMYYKMDELEYFKNHNFKIKILGKHAVVTELPFEQTKAQTVADSNRCRYCGITMNPKELVCPSCGARR